MVDNIEEIIDDLISIGKKCYNYLTYEIISKYFQELNIELTLDDIDSIYYLLVNREIKIVDQLPEGINLSLECIKPQSYLNTKENKDRQQTITRSNGKKYKEDEEDIINLKEIEKYCPEKAIDKLIYLAEKGLLDYKIFFETLNKYKINDNRIIEIAEYLLSKGYDICNFDMYDKYEKIKNYIANDISNNSKEFQKGEDEMYIDFNFNDIKSIYTTSINIF
ncbi:MAG: hypothetical protein ACPLKS_08245 [Caldisericum exile]|uniref:hypothetical protein n=1 Tax=Caldisericum exile TaxID=693075 RepID=UPI003C73BC42